MRSRIFFLLILALASLNLFAQPKIESITYNGDEATLTRNSPPIGITYYWQGTSCGELTDNSASTYIATTSSTYYLREYYILSGNWASSCASTIVLFPDITDPVLSNVTTGPVEPGDYISATSNENGMIYLVPDGTPAILGDVIGSRVASAIATAWVAVNLSTTIAGLGDFIVYAVDASDNLSAASAAISVADLTDPVLSDVTAGPVEPGENISATSNEDGNIFLVPDGTAADLGSIDGAKVSFASASAGVAVSLSTTSVGLGDYIVYAVDASDNISAASVAISVVDVTAPVLSDVTAGPVEPGENISATSNEDGNIFLVPDGTAANLGSIDGAKVASATATSGVAVSLSTTGIGLGDYIVYAVDASDNISAASAAISVVDLTAPVLSDVTAGPVEPGENISATSNEDGNIYLVPDGTAPNLGSIDGAKVASATTTAGVAVSLSTTGIGLGNYIVYAVDASDNISAASAAISVVDLTAPVLSGVTAGPVEPGENISATSNEDGNIYLVPEGTAANLTSIDGAKVAFSSATAGVAVSLSTTGIGLGDYIIYAVDASDNISDASAAISVADLTAPVLSDVTTGQVEPGDNISATSNEDGIIYLVPDGTAANLGSIDGAKVAFTTASAGVAVSLSTTTIGLGDFILYAVDASDNISVASAVISVEDVTAPLLSDVTPGPVNVGDDILATTNEDGVLYLVPDGTATNLGDIETAKVAEVAAVAGVPGTLATTGIGVGDYIVHAVDASDNVSDASSVIVVNDPTGLETNKATFGLVQLYPTYVQDILHIKSKIRVSSATVYSFLGTQIIRIGSPTDYIDMSGLDEGIYIVSIKLSDNSVYNSKVIKH